MSDEKRGLESGALSQFSDWFESEFGPGRFVFDQFLDPPMPDALCFLDGEPVHVEIAHFYGTESDARLLLGRIGKSAPTPRERRESAMVPLDNRLLVPLNRLLEIKADKNYAARPVWLLIRSAFPLCDVAYFSGYKAQIRVPSRLPFEQIWLLCGPRVSLGACKLHSRSARKASTYPRYSIANGQRQRTRRNR
jgi:hypothetical protein